MSVRNYDPSQHAISFLGINILDIQDGTFLDVEAAEDMFKSHTGSLGNKTVTRILDKGGKVTLTLMAAGPTNDLLAAILADAELFGLMSGQTCGSLQIRELNGNTRVHAETAWIMKAPKIDRAKESGSTVWVFECADLEIHPGGNDLT